MKEICAPLIALVGASIALVVIVSEEIIISLRQKKMTVSLLALAVTSVALVVAVFLAIMGH